MSFPLAYTPYLVLDPFFEDRESNGGAPAEWLAASLARLKREEVDNAFLPDTYVT